MFNQNSQVQASEPMSEYAIVNQRIQRLEEEYDLLQYEVDGWCAWPILREPAVLALGTIMTSRKLRDFAPPWHILLRTGLRDTMRLLHLPNKHYVVNVRSSSRAAKHDGLFEDVIFDQLLLQLDDQYIKVEGINNRAFFHAGKDELIPSYLTTIIPAAITRAAIKMSFAPAYLPRLAELLYTRIQQGLGQHKWSQQDVLARLIDFYWRKKFYRWLLRRIQPKILLLVVADMQHALVAAAKELGILVIDFQHGIILPDHPGYSWTTYAIPYKPRMSLPDQFWVYGSYWQNVLTADGFWDKELRSVGSLRMDRYREEYIHQPHEACIFVVTTQTARIDEEIIPFLRAFLETLGDAFPYEMHIKLHPVYGYQPEAYQQAFQAFPSVHVIRSNEEPGTFALLARADFHMSVTSTCHYEALALGTPTIILPLSIYRMLLPLCKTGYAFVPSTPADLLRIVQEHWGQRVPKEVGDRFFRSGAVDHMQRELGLLHP
jgi:hypothetical protein